MRNGVKSTYEEEQYDAPYKGVVEGVLRKMVLLTLKELSFLKRY